MYLSAVAHIARWPQVLFLVALCMSYIPLKEPLPPLLLDALLAQGWYRMQQHVFTTNELWLDENVKVAVCWARVRLDRFSPNHRHRKLTRLCRRFTCTLHEAMITPEIEALYTAYRSGIDFEAGPTAASFLIDERGVNYFPARMWQVRDGARMIAAGYFDEGVESAAGILNFFHPEYRKYSLGLWLYLEDLCYAAAQGKEFFYPGYIAIGYTKFDYKLLAGIERIELLDADTSTWIPYAESAHARQFSMIG